ncbi:hydroxymethylbilane synthase [Verrucomicrobia bacterium]|nr:hydroxymethylbilane synthase [Verrucomicrobiota bacterium]
MGLNSKDSRIFNIATRGSALALVQSRHIQSECRRLFPDHSFELKIMKTTGDHLQKATEEEANAPSLPKGLFTKELESALLDGKADMAVHSLKDLPTELPPNLKLGAITEREDVREVLIFKKVPKISAVQNPAQWLSTHACVATNSPRRQVQLKQWNPGFRVVPMRGNVPTRLRKLAENKDIDATVLARAGLNRLGYCIEADGRLTGPEAPDGLFAVVVDVDQMLPCVGQGCLGIEMRSTDQATQQIVDGLSHADSTTAANAERAFLKHMGGGCQTPYAAFAQLNGDRIALRGRAFHDGQCHDAELEGRATESESLGIQLAEALKP